MASTASDADQQWLRQSCAPLSYTLTLHRRAMEKHSRVLEHPRTPPFPQSYTTTATSIATHFNSTGTKHGSTEAGGAITMETTPTESEVGVEGGSIRVYGSHLDPSADPEPNVQTLCQTNSTSTGDVDFDSPLPT
ncbi:hypothetical protein V2G26_001828 [Clonostachys chloroleuca]